MNNKMQKECHKIAKDNGFDLDEPAFLIMEIIGEAKECLDCLDIKVSNRVKPCLALIERGIEDFWNIRKTMSLVDNSTIKDRKALGFEMFDVQCRVATMAEENKFDLEKIGREKMEINRHRPYRHGNVYYEKNLQHPSHDSIELDTEATNENNMG